MEVIGPAGTTGVSVARHVTPAYNVASGHVRTPVQRASLVMAQGRKSAPVMRRSAQVSAAVVTRKKGGKSTYKHLCILLEVHHLVCVCVCVHDQNAHTQYLSGWTEWIYSASKSRSRSFRTAPVSSFLPRVCVPVNSHSHPSLALYWFIWIFFI